MAYAINDSCVNCGACAAECPVNAISQGDTQFIIDADTCIDCGNCANVCPVGALTQKDFEAPTITSFLFFSLFILTTPSISDIIAKFINDMIEDEKSKEVIIQRNELADKFNCAPSQINYVLTTRFTTEKGYLIESRRGGGGYIIIKRIEYNSKEKQLEEINQSIGDSLTYNSAILLIEHLYDRKLITKREFEIIKRSINDRTLGLAEDKNKLRAEMLKGIIMVILS